MIDPNDALSLEAAGEMVGRTKKTIQRWISTGVRGRKLESWPLGGSTVTTKAAIQWFMRPRNSEQLFPATSGDHAAAMQGLRDQHGF